MLINLLSIMKLISRILVVLILFNASARILLAQDQACHNRLLPAFVTDKNGNTLRNFSSSDFQFQSLGTPISIVSWAPDGRRHRVVILLDVSRSMRGISGSGFWNSVTAIAQHVAGIQSENAQFALVLFSDQVVETVGFSKGNDAVRRRVDDVSTDPTLAKLPDKGGTVIFDALKAGFHELEAPTSADSLLVITDGMDEGSKSKPDEILTLLSGPMVRVFSIMVVDPIFSGSVRTLDEPSSGPFVDLVQKSGGRIFGPVDLKKAALTSSSNSESRRVLSEQLVQFYRGILQNDLLTIRPSSDITKPEALRLSLSDSAQRQWKHTHVFYPHEIGPCPGSGLSGNAPGA
jgi:hypothetical protein